MSGGCMKLFDFPKVKIEKKIRLIELFAGIGAQAMALRDIGADFEHYKVIEFDKYAVASYNAIHGTDFKPTDICDVHAADLEIAEKDKYCYLLTYSFPCQSLSVAGKMEGMSRTDWENGKSTRSGLLWEVERILGELPKEQLPDILLMENVPQVHAEQNKADFDLWCEFLRKKGYQNFRKDLNARDYGIPQNRKRCFMVSVLADDFVDFEFPKPIRLEKVMKDFLEDSVAEKYYINSPKARQLIEKLIANGTLDSKKKFREQRIMRTIDLCVKNPREITVANCIKARYDCGISNLQADGSGVVEGVW
ncbi:MAG: DNA (cytosine-5-)-methyltransferase [Firmicutes bacterium]|nr:DNA (cytosine-5-)-methyltransferase [Bacillota bacterium]MBR0031899.1 DNA (cytosine-5-)-methyltransferase [Treponema sp.]